MKVRMLLCAMQMFICVHCKVEDSDAVIRLVWYDFDETLTAMPHAYADDEDDAEQTFGGAKRLQRLRQHLETVTSHGATCGIISTSKKDHIIAILASPHVKLAQYFDASNIYGLAKIGAGKVNIIKAQTMGFHPEQILFVDDMPDNIEAADDADACRTVSISVLEDSMTEEHMERIEAFCNAPQRRALV